MNTTVLKYQIEKELNDKQTYAAVSVIKSLGYFVFKVLTFWIPKANSDYYDKRLDNIDYWYIEVNAAGVPIREIGFEAANRALLFAPTTKNRGLWTDSNITLDKSEYENISKDIFDDIFEAMEVSHIDCIREKINKYLKKWTDGVELKAPEMPILIFDLDNIRETLYCNSYEILYDSDITGYEWEGDKKFIDNKGNVYATEYINFGHPVGCVFPKQIEKNLTLNNFKQLIENNFATFKNQKLNGQTFDEVFKEFERLSK